MSRKQQVYSDFSGGFNDSVAGISINDNEVCISENADYSAEVKSFKTRKGCSKLNTSKFNYNVTDIHGWSIGSKNKKCIVVNGNLYDMEDCTSGLPNTPKQELSTGATKIYPFVLYNRFYFGDGTKLYVWGDFDYESETSGTISLDNGKIVKNTSSTATGVLGNFYKYLGTSGTSVDLTTATYTDTTTWKNVTEAPYFASSEVREVLDEDKSAAETVRISVTSGSTTQANIVICLDNVAYSVQVGANKSVSEIIALLPTATSSGTAITSNWDYETDSNSVVFTKKSTGVCANGYVDPTTTGATLTYTTEVEGARNDNDLSPIRKCTMFVVHTASYRVFATGNPDDNAVFYSEIGEANYFKSETNKVYAQNSYGKPTGMKQLSESVLVSFEMGWYAWSGITPLDDATWKPLNIPYGCVANNTIELTPNSFIFLAKDGIYNVSASILNYDVVLLQNRTIINKITRSKVDNTINDIYAKENCKAVFDGNVYYLAYNVNDASEYSNKLTYDVGDYCTHESKRYICTTAIATAEEWNSSHWALSVPTNDYVLKYEWDTESFTTITGWMVNGWLKDYDGLFFATENFVLKANDGYADIDTSDGSAKDIDLYIKTKEYHFGNPLSNKVVNLIGLIFKQQQAQYSVEADVNIIMGYESYEVDTLSIDESLVWGRNWGLIWGFREAIVKMIELTRSSNTFQLEIRSSTQKTPLSLIAIGFVYEETDFVKPTNYKDEDLLQ